MAAASSEYRMLEETADEENGFQAATTLLVSSSVIPAALPTRGNRYWTTSALVADGATIEGTLRLAQISAR